MRLKQVAVFVAATAGLVLAGAGSASAAPAAPDSDISVRAGSVVLTPAPGGGYLGKLAVQVHYEGPEDAYFHVPIDHPDGLYLELDGPDEDLSACFYTAPKQGAMGCGLSTELSPGETRTLHLTYTALTAPQVKTRLTGLGSITVTGRHLEGGDELVDATPANNTARFRGALRGTGAGIAPRVYQPAEHTDLSLTSGADRLVFAAQGDGTYRAVVTAAIGAKNDAFHQNPAVELVTPVPGLKYLDIEPTDTCYFTPTGGMVCGVYVEKIAQNTSRTIGLGLVTTELPLAGTVLEFKAHANVGGELGDDANPADNTLRLVVA